ncbi:unnamed protein product [Staurois parvus]|nr:unnamed protein product [Staurois parvus]
MTGVMSYIKTCEDKLMKLENSKLGEHIRRNRLKTNVHSSGFSHDVATKQSSLHGSSAPVPESPSSVYSNQYESSAVDVPFGTSMSESSPTGISDNIAQGPEFYEEKQGKPPSVTYEELRNKNRGVYDVLKPQTPERPIQRRTPTIEAKKNKYGDVWEE